MIHMINPKTARILDYTPEDTDIYATSDRTVFFTNSGLEKVHFLTKEADTCQARVN